MMRRLGRLGFSIFLLCLTMSAACFFATPARAASVAVIEAIRQGGQGNNTRIVIESNAPLTFRAFLLAAPNRLVIDVPTVSWRASRSGFFQGRTVKGYRSGELADGLTRIVFDLAHPALIDKAFVLPAGGTLKNRLVVDVAPTTQNLFTAELDRVMGDADLRNKTLVSAPAMTGSDYRTIANTQVAAAVPRNALDQQLPVKKPGYLSSPTQQMGALMPPPPPTAPASTARRVIILDAGHGGHDPGAIGAGKVREKEITLAMAKALKTELEATGRYKVYLTRDTDIFIPLRQRVAIARAKGAELFISLHADKVDRSNVRGASMYTLSETASDTETARLAERENKAGIVAGVDLSGEEADVADILLDLAMREKMNESNLLARFLEESMRRKNIKLLPNSHRSAGFAVLKAPDVPSVLIEIGFLSNAEEAKLLTSNAFRENLARALRDGVDAYFTKILALQKI